MDKLEEMKNWLESFYDWGDAQWEIDLTGCTPVSYSLTREDDRVTGRKEDVAGASRLSLQVQFSLIRVSYGEENPDAWVEEFSSWVRWQVEENMAPCFGEGITRFRLEKGKLEICGDKAVYTAKLIGTYEELYEVSYYGKN